MKTKDQIKVLLENGIRVNTISKMNENQIKVLVKRFTLSEQATPQNTTPQTITTTKYVVNPNSKTTVNGVEIDTTGGKTTATPMQETELSEKFESKAQQGLFWSKCKNSSGKTKEKWCKMAKEFSDSTTKKQYEKMPEKKHLEKNETNEDYEDFLEDSIVEMLQKHINPSMTKGDILKTINEKTKDTDGIMLSNPKKNTMFSKEEGKEMKTMKKSIRNNTEVAPTKPDTDTDTKEKDKDKDRKNPFQPKHRPKPKAKREFKEQTTAPTKPDTDTDTDTKEKDKGRKNPFQPKHNPAPKAGKGSLPNFLTWNKLGVNLK
jgi:hypothetical protein